MNVVTITGRLAADPELHYTPAGKAVTTVRLAVQRIVEEGADWVNVVVWEKQAENLVNFCTKGRMIGVTGRLQSRTYETQDGHKREVHEVIAREVQYLDRKPGAAASEGSEVDGSKT